MKTKIQITPAMREFNEQIEHADFMLDYQFDQESADVLLMRLKQAKCYPASALALEKAMAGIAVVKALPNPKCVCGKDGSWHGYVHGSRIFCCDKCWLGMLKSRPELADEQLER